MASFMDLKGTTETSFLIGTGGTRVRNNSGVLEARNSTDTSYIDFKCDTLDIVDLSGSRTNLKVPASDPTGVTGADAISNMMSLTQAEYNAITPDGTTLYFIVG